MLTAPERNGVRANDYPLTSFVGTKPLGICLGALFCYTAREVGNSRSKGLVSMEHKIVAVEVRQNALVYECSCGQKFIGPGADSFGRAKVPESLGKHLDSKKGE